MLNKAEDTLFQRFNLPSACLVESTNGTARRPTGTEPVKQAHSDQEDHLSLADLAPSAQFKDLFGQRQKRYPREPSQTATEHDSPVFPTPHVQPAKAGTEVGDLGSIMVKILEAQAEASLRLHQNLLENFRVTSAAVGATGTNRDARLLDAKLRILQACAGGGDDGPFVPSKLYLEVD